MFCPACGLKLLRLAEGHGDADDLIRKRSDDEVLLRGEEFTFYVCGKCKTLLLHHGKYDFNFKKLGVITDESLAMLITNTLKGERS